MSKRNAPVTDAAPDAPRSAAPDSSKVEPSLFSQIAAKVGVTPAAVTLAMQDSASISAGTKQRVFWASRKLGYRLSRAKHRKLLNIAVIVGVGDAAGTLQTSKDVEIWEGLSGSTEQNEMSLHTYILPPPGNRLEFKDLPVLIRRDQIDGVVVMGLAFAPLLAFLRKAKIPTVVASNLDLSTPIDQVKLNIVDGAKTLTRMLIEKGHKRIGFVINGSNQHVHQQMFRSFQEVLEQHNLFDERLVRTTPDSDIPGIWPCSELFAESSPPTAIFAPTDKAATHVAHAAIHARIPFDQGFIIGTCGHQTENDVAYASIHVNTNATKAGILAFQRLMELHENYKQAPAVLHVECTVAELPSTVARR